MQRISFAPVLSATLSRDSCWIIGFLLVVALVLGSHRALRNFVQPDGWVYLAFSRTSTTRQRLVADSGRVSMIRTRSPMPHWFCSSWALSLLVRRRTLPYSACLTRSSTETTTVFSILSLTTRPSRTLRVGRVPVFSAGAVWLLTL